MHAFRRQSNVPMIVLILLGAPLPLAAPAQTVDPQSADSATLHRFEFSEKHMAVDFGIVLYAADEAQAKTAATAAYARIKQIDECMSDYSPTSELSRLSNTAPTPRGVPLGDDLFRVLTKSREISELTGGSFDCTVGSVIKIWRRARRTGEMPSAEAIAAGLKSSGYKSLEIDSRRHTARLLKSGMRLDLGAIAKGYASDAGLAEMKKLGIARALVNGSGDIAAGDPPPGKKGWRIGVAPLDLDGPPSRHVLIANAGISTSGDSVQHVKIGGKQFSHVIDPTTGIALTDHCSVTIIARDCTTSDSLGTGISVMGPKAGLALVEKLPDVAAFIVRKPADKAETHESTRFRLFVDANETKSQENDNRQE